MREVLLEAFRDVEMNGLVPSRKVLRVWWGDAEPAALGMAEAELQKSDYLG